MKILLRIALAAALWLLFACLAPAGPQTRALLEKLPPTWPVPQSYKEARQQAIDRGLPLVVWSGAAL